MSICLHGYSLVVVVISSCFGMKLESKYASVRLLEQLSVVYESEKSFLQNTSDSCFSAISVWKLVLGLGKYLVCWHISFHVIFVVKHTRKSTEFLTGCTGCHKQKDQSNCRSFFLSVLFVVISQMMFLECS